MGRILCYVVLLSNLSLILALQQSLGNNYERGKQENLTHAIKQYFPKEQNDFFNKKALPLDFLGRRKPSPPRAKQMRTSPGLQAFAIDSPEWKTRKRNFSHSNIGRRYVAPPFSHVLYPRKNSKTSWSNFRESSPSIRLSKVYNPNNALQSRRPEDVEKKYKDARNARYNSRHSAKTCDSCNSVPWIPVIKVPDSYRQQRTHVTELRPVPQQNLNYDYHSFASNTHDVLLPAVPLVPPLEPVYDGTISSSFGLPLGNIPTSHGLLAPINHAANTIDFSSSFNYFAPQGLLESHPFPELSQVPIVPIHDSGQFYQFDSQTPDLVPPPTKTVDVSNVVLTISEENSAKLEQSKPVFYQNINNNYNPNNINNNKNHNDNNINNHNNNINDHNNNNIKNHINNNNNNNNNNNHHHHHHSDNYHNLNYNRLPNQDLSSDSTAVDSQESHPQDKEKHQNKDFNRLEIVKSIPLAEFTSFHQQDLPLYPPLQSESSSYDSETLNTQKSVTHHPDSNYNFLVPPLKPNVNFTFYSNNSIPSPLKPHDNFELEGESSAPKPLTSSSLSWLFVDHTAPPGDSKSTASVSSFVTEAHEIASVVNNELRPVSPSPFSVSSPSVQNVGNSKSKKIQIIIPYTTKNKNEHDNNALESVQHEVFQSPVSKSTSENNFHDFATSALPPLTRPSETNDGILKEFTTSNQQTEKTHRYLKEMQHVIASNLRELLKEEIEKKQSDQNYPLQNNIDNWTALEYSNHKTVETKAPKEIVTQALAVTSIPGISISHLLLPSKKIPKEYFVTTPLPVYDEPSTFTYKATNSTINSSPFTAKPYATTNIYNPTRSLGEVERPTPSNGQINHENNHTEVVRGKVNNRGKLNENLVQPDGRSKTRRVEQTTSTWTSSLYASSGKEKVQIVTPISLTNLRNYSTTSFRRTTRQIHQTTQKPIFLNRLNSTKLEKVSNKSSPFNQKFSYNSTSTSSVTVLSVDKTNSSVIVGESDLNTNETASPKNLISEKVKSEHLSINDIFPFRNKELPWESNFNNSEVLPIERQRKSLIKQVNLQRSKVVAESS